MHSFPETQAAAQNFLQQGRRESGHRSVLFLYVEVGGRLRTKLEEIFSSRLEVADGALQNGDLRHRIAGRFQFCANLFFEIRRIPYTFDKEIEKPFDWEKTLGLELFHDVIADGYVAAPHVEHHIIMAIFPNAFEP